MAESPLTTVVVVSHNYARFLRDAVQSAVAQTASPRVLVVDDASTDDTPEVLARLAGEHPSIACHVLRRGSGSRACAIAPRSWRRPIGWSSSMPTIGSTRWNR